jgi:hypothetical protein
MDDFIDRHEEVCEALVELMDTVFLNDAIVSVIQSFEHSEPTLLVGVLRELVSDLPETLSIDFQGGLIGVFRIEQFVSEPIEYDVLEASEAEKLIQLQPSPDPSMGGDWCRNTVSNSFGTVTITARTVEIEGSYDGHGNPRYRCAASPGMISNNHVIARRDQGVVGELISTARSGSFASLQCWIPLSDNNVHVDAAIAIISDPSFTSFKQIRGLGQITGIRQPKPRERIRKSGARTNVTTGRVIGRGTVRPRGKVFKAWQESDGMSCPGDSGAPIVSDGMKLIGIHTWGSGACNGDRRCLFFDLVGQQQLAILFNASEKLEELEGHEVD